MSVAGKREGMKHAEQGDEKTTRSGLFYEAVRIIEEMRKATNGEYPKYAVWENVPGAFSSNKGRDFHAVLEALCSVKDDTVSIPEPYDAKRTKLVWHGAGEIVGDNYSVAWRTLDAQYWGVPQRRKRIYLVADFTGRRAGEILFKQDGLSGNLPQSNEAGQEVTADAVGGVDGSVVAAGFKYGNSAQARSIGYEEETSPTLSGAPGGNEIPTVVALVQPLVLKERAGCEGGGKGALWSDKAFTLATNQDMSVIALQANGIDRADTAGNVVVAGFCQGASPAAQTIGYQEEVSPTIKGAPSGTAQVPAVLYEPKSALEENWGEASVKNALRAGASKSSHAVVQEAYTMQRSDEYQECNVASTQSARQYKSATDLVVEKKRKYIIRRLTPTECARLQGFPNIVEVDMTDITRDELVAIALSAGYIKVNIASGEVFATRGPGGMERDTPVLLSGANVNGYKVYSLHANGVKKQIRANRLVWIAAHGAIPDGMVVDHINNDKQDNRVSNLQLLTAGQNSAKAHDDGCYLVGDDNPNCKIKECERKTISFLYWHTNMPYRILAEHFGISHSRAQQIIHEYEWGHLAPYDPADAEFWEDVRKTHAEINGKKYKPVKDIKKWYDKLHTDSTEYKMWGNGIALPCAEYVIRGIAEQGAKTLGSLFDGSGGFPLAGAMNGIKPLWASEVEPYPIAVTKSRFKEDEPCKVY